MTRKTKPSKGKRAGARTETAPAKKDNPAHPNLRAPWKPGESGNPSGMSKARRRIKDAIALAAREKLAPDEAMSELWSVYTDESVPWPVRYNALTEIIDRAYGKAPQVVEIDGDTDSGGHAALKKLAVLVGGVLAVSDGDD
jgi:hypothetical protein